jgi:hypothetical protein
MKRRLLLIALAISPAMGLADPFSGADKKRNRELRDKFIEQKNTLQKQYKEKPEAENNKTTETNKTDAGDRNNLDD